MGDCQALSRGRSETSSSECRQTLVPIPVLMAMAHPHTHSPLLLPSPGSPTSSALSSQPTACPSGGPPGTYPTVGCMGSEKVGRQGIKETRQHRKESRRV